MEKLTTYSGEDAVESIRQKLRPRRELKESVLPRGVFFIFGIEVAQELNAIHELRDTCRDVVVTVEPNRSIGDGLRSVL